MSAADTILFWLVILGGTWLLCDVIDLGLYRMSAATYRRVIKIIIAEAAVVSALEFVLLWRTLS